MTLIITSARIFTGDPRRPWAQALAVRGNRIVAVGDNRTVRRAGQAGGEVYDLPGRLVTPGLVDSHCHFVYYGLFRQVVPLRGLTSLAACRERIRQAASARRPGQWLVGEGWDHYLWDEAREPTRRDLDDLTPETPAVMIRSDGHTMWVNSRVLAWLNLGPDPPDPAGGRIERDPLTGEPTGLLRDAAYYPLRDQLHAALEDWKTAAAEAQEAALRLGLTGVHTSEDYQRYQALAALEAEGRLELRVHHLLRPDDFEIASPGELESGRGSPRLWLSHVKLLADGSLGSGTALLHEPYADDSDHWGAPVLNRDELEAEMARFYRLGWDVAVHAIGDRAVTNVLEAVAAARARCGIRPGEKRDRIEHVQLFRSRDLPRYRELGLVAAVQPVFMATDWRLAERKWGRTRCRRAYAWKTLIEAGLPVQLGSDAPFDRIEPLLGLQAAVTRRDSGGQPPGGWFPEERLTLDQALRAYTAVPAWTSRREDRLGSITPGKLADLTVFREDLFQTPPERWPEVPVEMTVIDGRVVYRLPA